MLFDHGVIVGIQNRHRIITGSNAVYVLHCHKHSLRPVEEGAQF